MPLPWRQLQAAVLGFDAVVAWWVGSLAGPRAGFSGWLGHLRGGLGAVLPPSRLSFGRLLGGPLGLCATSGAQIFIPPTGFHGILGLHHGKMIVLDQRICAKVKDKLVLSTVWMMRDTWISLGPCFPLVIL